MRMGIDFGASKIEVALWSPGGDVLFRRRYATPRRYLGDFEALAPLMRQATREAGETCGFGLGIAGNVSPATGLVKTVNSTRLNGKRLARDRNVLAIRRRRIPSDTRIVPPKHGDSNGMRGAARPWSADMRP